MDDMRVGIQKQVEKIIEGAPVGNTNAAGHSGNGRAPSSVNRAGSKVVPMAGLVPAYYPKEIAKRGDTGIQKYQSKMQAGIKIEPIKVEGRVIIDGSHRFWAAKAEGYDHIAAIVKPRAW